MKKIFFALSVGLLILMGVSEAMAATCTAKLQRNNGVVLEVFHGRAYEVREACIDANNQCRRVKRAGYYRGNPQCIVKIGNRDDRSGHRGRNQRVQRSCNARFVNVLGSVRGEYGAVAVGRRGTGVKAEACRNAIRKCVDYNRFKVGGVCRADNGTRRRIRI